MVRRETSWEVSRPVSQPDGAGGQTVVLTLVGIERGDVRELVGAEIVEARQAGAEHTHTGFFRLRADIVRGDELRRGMKRLRVLTVSEAFPPGIPRVRVTARSVEAGG